MRRVKDSSFLLLLKYNTHTMQVHEGSHVCYVVSFVFISLLYIIYNNISFSDWQMLHTV
jgi:hypothetical protein